MSREERDRRWAGRPLQLDPGFPLVTRDSLFWQPDPAELEYTEYVLTLQPGPLSRAALQLPLPEPWNILVTVEYGPPGVELFYGTVLGTGEIPPIQGQAIQVRGSTVRVSALRLANDQNENTLDLSCSIVAGRIQSYYKNDSFLISGPGAFTIPIPALAVSWKIIWGREPSNNITVDQLSSTAAVVLTSTTISSGGSAEVDDIPYPPSLGIHPLAAFLRVTATVATQGVILWEIKG